MDDNLIGLHLEQTDCALCGKSIKESNAQYQDLQNLKWYCIEHCRTKTQDGKP